MNLAGKYLSFRLRREENVRRRMNLAKRFQNVSYDSVRSWYGPVLVNGGRDRTYLKSIAGRFGEFIPNILKGRERPFVFFDFGANTGIFSFVAATSPACQAVVAFEPNPDLYCRLLQSAKLNDCEVQAWCAAVSDHGQKAASFLVPVGHSGRGHLGAGAGSASRSIDVMTVGRTFLDSLSLPDGVEIIAKVDVEGHEAMVLRELFSSSLGSRVGDLIVEFSHDHDAAHLKQVSDLLADSGFREADRVAASPDDEDRHFVRS